MEDDNSTAAHPTLMLVLQDGFLCCLLLRWSKSRFPRPTTVSCLSRPHRGVFHRKVKKGGVSGAVLGLPLSAKLKETDTPKSNGMTHRIHYMFLVYHCRGSNRGQPANTTSSHCHQVEVSTASPSSSRRTHCSPELESARAFRSGT